MADSFARQFDLNILSAVYKVSKLCQKSSKVKFKICRISSFDVHEMVGSEHETIGIRINVV